MRTIGIRAAPAAVTFAIFDTDTQRLLNVEEIRIPVALHLPEALKYVRSTILDVLREYDVRQGCVRVMESTAQSPNTVRTQIEGVIQESFASSTLSKYFVGQISSISSRLGIERSRFKPIVEGIEKYDRIENWDEFDECEREAILSAIGAQNA